MDESGRASGMADLLTTERCTVIVVSRDRFSTTTRCLASILASTPEELYDLVVVLGGAPKSLERSLSRRYGRARFLFEPRFLNPAQARNLGLKAARTRLAVLMDNDVDPRAGWLEALLRCEKETGAAMVVPVVLEAGEKIHAAGNDLLVFRKDGKTFGQKTLRFYQAHHHPTINLKREPVDYGELHCQLVNVRTAVDLHVYDEHIQEVGEVDSGLTWKKAGCAMYFEPHSVVSYNKPEHITRPEDIRFFAWRWDMRKILEGYRYFEEKWGMDISDAGNFKDFLVIYNCKLGLASRVFPNRFGVFLDAFFRKFFGAPGRARKIWRKLKAVLWGYGEWNKENEGRL